MEGAWRAAALKEFKPPRRNGQKDSLSAYRNALPVIKHQYMGEAYGWCYALPPERKGHWKRARLDCSWRAQHLAGIKRISGQAR